MILQTQPKDIFKSSTNVSFAKCEPKNLTLNFYEQKVGKIFLKYDKKKKAREILNSSTYPGPSKIDQRATF